MKLPSTSSTILYVFGSFASLSRHLVYRAVAANVGLRPPLFVLKRHSRGTLWYDLFTAHYSRERICYPGRHSMRFTIYRLSRL